jgi:hypothetical protein
MLKILGILIVAGGIFIWCGNVFGFFPTVPLAGYATIVVGGMVVRSGK